MRALVTGGGGFLGRALTEQLLARGDEVRVVGRHRYPEVEALGAEGFVADLSKEIDLSPAMEGVDRVFHTAARAGVWGPREDFEGINVHGTRRVLEAARAAGVGQFVYTGSPSCTFDGRDAENATEADCPYPQHFEAIYPETKAVAERLVLEADDADGMRTCAVRPHLIWGPRDPHLLPRVIARRHKLKIVGTGENRVGITYVDNAAAAHVQAGDALAEHARNAGRACFVHDPEPVAIWPWLNDFLTRLGLEPVTGRVSLGAARGVGTVLEGAWRLFGLSGEPPMTRFVASQLALSHWYDLTAAREDFGYQPLVGPDEGLERAVAWFREQLADT